ncbi:heavy-metal-associated domain-containing protein [Nocardioides bizhenqiangii]|uniref:Cation transporter n=1 Tax=Nocardioides bizhenqiangii TaxID=3095076 RepID=A0ABZ0ZV37_9ACTN|nr:MULTISPECIES: cation transporter [unclassified Nocardioides]MDZ5623650.1 cation transporter [Nocardioides sp. HM23]WQQ27784.1 cation transporter [Nocardioides sp. HM61]
MAQMTLFVGGMTCRRCIREVTARLRDVAGVETVAADIGTSTVRLGGVMVTADVLRAFVGTTYQAEVVANSDGTATGKSGP